MIRGRYNPFNLAAFNAKLDHGSLTGLDDADHNAVYFTESEHLNSSAGAGDAGKPVILDVAGHIDASMINDGDVSHNSLAGLDVDDYQHLTSSEHTELTDWMNASGLTLGSNGDLTLSTLATFAIGGTTITKADSGQSYIDADAIRNGSGQAVVTVAEAARLAEIEAQADSRFLYKEGGAVTSWNDTETLALLSGIYTAAAFSWNDKNLTNIADLTMAGTLKNTLAAADTQGIISDGATNAFVYTGADEVFYDLNRTVTGSGSDKPTVRVTGLSSLLIWDYDYAGSAASLKQYVGANIGITASGDWIISSGNPALRTSEFSGLKSDLAFTGTLETNTGFQAKQKLVFFGLDYLVKNQGTFTRTDGTNQADFVGANLMAEAAVAAVTGTVTLGYYGVKGTATGSADGVSTSYGGWFSGSGSDINYGIYVAAGSSVLLDTTIGDNGSNVVDISSTGDVSFAGSAGFYPRFLTQSAEPAAGTGATQCDTSETVIWKDSDDNKVYLCFNDGGTVKTAELI